MGSQTSDRDGVRRYGHNQQVVVAAGKNDTGDLTKIVPEQLLIGAVSSCHMLFFLAIAEAQGYRVETYSDRAVGYVEKNNEGSFWVSRIELAPTVLFGGTQVPGEAEIDRMHQRAHKGCFVANSLISEVTVAPPDRKY
jgi:organic hydroperoxide reductase OsmC/OhrA